MARHTHAAKLIAVAMIATGAAAAPARGQQIGQEALNYLGTYAFADSQHTWDQATEFSADTVLDHTREGYLPMGYVLPGGHIFYPSIKASSTYDDNLFLTPDDSKAWDIRSSIAPSFDFQAALPRNMFQVHGDAEVVEFKEHPDLNFVNANLKADWRIDIDAADTIGGTFQSRIGHDDKFLPIEPDNPSAAIPILSTRAAVGYAHDAGRTSVAAGADWERNTYLDVPSYSGGTIDETTNDNIIVGGFGVLTYRWSPGYKMFAAGRIDRELLTNPAAAYADNNSYRAEAGLIYELDPLLKFTLSAGYQYIKFDNPSQYNTGAPVVKASVQWLPTRRMTVNFDVSQSIIRTLNGPDFGEVNDQVHGRIVYDIWHNITGSLDGSFENDQYIGSSRVDQQWSTTAGIDYLLNENLALTLSYQHTQRASNESQFDYSDNRYMLSLKLSK